MSREPVTLDSMVEHIEGFEELVEKADIAWKRSYALSKETAAIRSQMREELKEVDGHLGQIYDSLTNLARQIKSHAEASDRLGTVLKQVADLASNQAMVAEHVAQLRATPAQSMAHMRETQMAVDAAVSPGDGVVMLLDGKPCAVSLEELGVYLGLTDELKRPLSSRVMEQKE
jgi:septation ring formation regulator EzrA